MIENFESYFFKNAETPQYKIKNDQAADYIRYIKAKEQASLNPVPISMVYSYINEFLDECRVVNGYDKCCQISSIELDHKYITTMDNGIIVTNCKWIKNVWNSKTRKYSQFDSKYSKIQNSYSLKHSKNILWFKFTTDGYLGVVAKGQDIGFSYKNRSGKFVNSVSKEWDDSFVLIFPLTDEILGKWTTNELETAVGNYLTDAKKIPIIDFYSHNYDSAK